MVDKESSYEINDILTNIPGVAITIAKTISDNSTLLTIKNFVMFRKMVGLANSNCVCDSTYTKCLSKL